MNELERWLFIIDETLREYRSLRFLLIGIWGIVFLHATNVYILHIAGFIIAAIVALIIDIAWYGL